MLSIGAHDAFYDIIHTIEMKANLNGIILWAEYISYNALFFTKVFIFAQWSWPLLYTISLAHTVRPRHIARGISQQHVTILPSG